MNHGAMSARVTVQRTYFAPGEAAPAGTQVLPLARLLPKLTLTSASAMAASWNPTLFWRARARPAASARLKASAGIAGEPVNS